MPDQLPSRREFLRLTAGAGALACAGRAIPAEPAKPRKLPHIVLIVADDLGYADVGFHGGKVIPTPNLDRIAREGVRLARFYACPVCSPTRAGLMTGRYPLRMGLMRAVIPPWRSHGLPPAEQTIPEMLATCGYERRAIVGKWHLGHSARKYLPNNHGFTHFYGHYNGAIDYFTHQREGELDWHKNEDTCRDKGYSTTLLGAAAEKFIREHPTAGAGADKPFLLYVPFNAPHGPLQAEESDIRTFASEPKKRRRLYCAMVHAMDRQVGRILQALDDRGLADNTLVWFFSDNGGIRGVASNGPLRGGKATVYEGGIRVAAAARWPAGGLAGGRTVTGRMGYIDVMPTLRRIVGATPAPPKALDGVDVLDVLRGRGTTPDRPWFSYIHQGGQDEHLSVVTDQWKLVYHGPNPLDSPPGRKGKIELFDLTRDQGEQSDVSAGHPKVAKDLMAKLEEFRSWKVDGVPQYGVGRKGFKAPKDWKITE